MDFTNRLHMQQQEAAHPQAYLPAITSHDAYYFPEGLPGYEHQKCFTIDCPDDIRPLFHLRGVGNEEILFVCIDPFLACPDYDPRPGPVELGTLGLRETSHAIFISLVHITGQELSLNLRAPIVLNKMRRFGHQIDLGAASYALRFPMPHSFYGAHPMPAMSPPTESARQTYAGLMPYHPSTAAQQAEA